MDNNILIIDDSDLNRDLLTDILENEFNIITACDGVKGIEAFEMNMNSIEAVLLDLNMPVLDGYGVLDYFNKRGYIGKVPILIISAEDSNTSEKRCLDFGASDFIRRPFDVQIVKRRVCNMVEYFQYKNKLEEKVKEQTEEIFEQNIRLQKQTETLTKNNNTIIDLLGTIVESRDLNSGEHVQRVRDYTRIIAYKMMENCPEYNLTERKIEVISSAAALHDIGKVEIPDNVLLKPGKLTAEEFELMKTHTKRGCELIKRIKGAWDKEYGDYGYEICRYHHERFNGKGYPDGLKGDEIPISAQCVSIADVYDALVNVRCYKAAYTTGEAFKMIMSGDCGIFSPKLLNAFVDCRELFEKCAKNKL